MENAAEALKMGAWVLIFVVALSLCINSFSQARQTMDTILEYNDREYNYTYVEENGSTQRIVGYESIIPTIYRAYKENYKIIFPESYVLYYKKDSSAGTRKPINYIDLETESLSDDSMKEEFIKGILFGKNSVDSNMLGNFSNIEFNKSNALYEQLKNKKFIEYLGVYYQEETNGTSSTPNANKTRKRVITYEEVEV